MTGPAAPATRPSREALYSHAEDIRRKIKARVLGSTYRGRFLRYLLEKVEVSAHKTNLSLMLGCLRAVICIQVSALHPAQRQFKSATLHAGCRSHMPKAPAQPIFQLAVTPFCSSANCATFEHIGASSFNRRLFTFVLALRQVGHRLSRSIFTIGGVR